MIKLILFLVTQLLFLLLLLHLNEKRLKKMAPSGIAFFCAAFLYLSVLAVVIATNIILEHELDSFDLDHDGIFSSSEITPAQQLAMDRVIADTGRAFAPIFGIVYSIIYFLFLYIILKVAALAKKITTGIKPENEPEPSKSK